MLNRAYQQETESIAGLQSQPPLASFVTQLRNKKKSHLLRVSIQQKSLAFLLTALQQKSLAFCLSRMVFVNNYEFSRRGRLWVLWSSQVRLTPVFKTDEIVTVSVQIEGEAVELFCSFIYVDNTAERRRELWGDIKAHQNSPIFRNNEWVLMGDFNEILDGEEHSNYAESGVLTTGVREFEDVMQHCRLLNMGCQGPKFTWFNKRDAGIICKKLDRILVNEAWLQNRTQAYGVFEAGGCSDHLRGCFHLSTQAVGKNKPFKFTNTIAEMPELLTTVTDYWRDCQPLFQSTSALFRFSKSSRL